MVSNETETATVLSDTTRYVFYWPCDPRFCLGFDTSLGFCRCCIYNLSYCDSVKRANNYSGKTKKITAESFQCLAIKGWPLQIL